MPVALMLISHQEPFIAL